MKKLYKYIASGFVAASMLVPVFAFAQTPSGIEVEFEAMPLFSEANFLPDDLITRFIKVTNNRDTSRLVVTQATNVSDPSDFADALSLVIKQGVTTLYSDTLANFFAGGEVTLSTVASGATAQYDFTVTFNPASGNAYQEASLGFDILIGFQGETAVGSDGNVTAGGGGGGNSGAITGGAQGLAITTESASSVVTTEAVITWQTNFLATSRVVYGTVSGVFDINSPPNYGYPFSTVETDTPASVNGVTSHSVTLTGLTPATTYYYRVISTASPPTISYERSFTVAQPVPSESAVPRNSSSDGLVLAAETSELGDGSANESAIIVENEVAPQEKPLQVAQAASVLNSSWWWLVIFLLLIALVYLLLTNKKKEKSRRNRPIHG